MMIPHYTKVEGRQIDRIRITKHAIDRAFDRCHLPWRRLLSSVIAAIEGRRYALKGRDLWVAVNNGTAVCVLEAPQIVIVRVRCIEFTTQDERAGDRLTYRIEGLPTRVRCLPDHLEIGVHGRMFCSNEDCPRAGEDDIP